MKHSDIISKSAKQSNVKSGKNTHIEHLEDLLLTDNTASSKIIAQIFKDIVNKKAKVKIKYDGSPAIVFGHNPENKKFFVGTKSVFNKLTPKILYSLKDIQKFYSDSPELSNLLLQSFVFLKYITPKTGVFQGDLLFHFESLEKDIIENSERITFTPNTLTYSLPECVGLTDLGIAIHTSYSGKSIQSLIADYNVDLNKFKKYDKVWLAPIDVDLSRMKKIDIDKKIKEIGSFKIAKNVVKNIELMKIFKNFINYLIKNDKPLSSPNSLLNDFIKFYSKIKKSEILELKIKKNKNIKKNKVLEDFKFIKEHKKELLSMIKTYKLIIEVKTLLLLTLNDLNNIATFIKKGHELVKTAPEGFVVVNDAVGIVKLVDRKNFSKNNFLKQENNV